MLRLASDLRGRCDRVGAVIARLDAHLARMSYAGPAADRFRAALADQRRVLSEVQRILQEASDALNRTAAGASGLGRTV